MLNKYDNALFISKKFFEIGNSADTFLTYFLSGEYVVYAIYKQNISVADSLAILNYG